MSEGKDKTFEVVGKTLDAVDALTAAIQYSGHAYHWQKLRAYAEGLFSRAPFKVGDRVRLSKTPNINEKDSWGWMPYRHLLVKGAEGEVRSVDFRENAFNALVRFDGDHDGLFHFWETSLEQAAQAPGPAPGNASKGGE